MEELGAWVFTTASGGVRPIRRPPTGAGLLAMSCAADVLLLVAGAVTTYVPASRAGSVDPAETLRTE